MAATTMAPRFRYCFLLVLSIAAMIVIMEAKALVKMEISFYMYYWETATKVDNVKTIMIAGIPHKKWIITEFRTLFAYDDAITETVDRKSTSLVRAHGVYVNTALDGSDLHIILSFVFTNKAYNGSTLEIQGADRWLLPVREVSIVSGTGKFRLARGYTSIETMYQDKDLNAILRWNLTVFHY